MRTRTDCIQRRRLAWRRCSGGPGRTSRKRAASARWIPRSLIDDPRTRREVTGKSLSVRSVAPNNFAVVSGPEPQCLAVESNPAGPVSLCEELPQDAPVRVADQVNLVVPPIQDP